MQYPGHADYRSFRDELLHDYEPVNAQERLLVNEVAATWRRVEECRERERLFFSLMRAKEGLSDKPGTEVTIWYDKPHKAYDQICRAIRDAELAFDRAAKRIAAIQDRRLRREKVVAKPAKVAAAEIPQEWPEIAMVAGAGGPRLVTAANRASNTS